MDINFQQVGAGAAGAALGQFAATQVEGGIPLAGPLGAAGVTYLAVGDMRTALYTGGAVFMLDMVLGGMYADWVKKALGNETDANTVTALSSGISGALGSAALQLIL